MAELKRVFSYKRWLLLILCILVNLCLFAYKNIPLSKNDISERTLKSQEEYISGYNGYVTAIINKAEELQKFSIFAEEGTFAYSNIIKTSEDFERISNVNVSVDESQAVSAFTEYHYSFYIAFVFMLGIIYELFRYRDNGMWAINCSTAKGREYIAVSSIFAIIIGGFISVVSMAVTTFILALLIYGGAGDIGNAIQNIKQFSKFTYPVSKIEYVIILIIISSIVIIMLGLIIWSVFVAFRQRNNALLCLGLFIGVEIILYRNISIQSRYNVFHFINIINLLQINDMIRTYINWGFRYYVFSAASVTLFVTTITTVLLMCMAYYRCIIMKPYGKRTIIDKITGKINEAYQHVLKKMPQICKELHKLIFSGYGLWLIVTVIFVTCYFSRNNVMHYNDAQIVMDKMYIEHGGYDSSYIRSYVEEKQEAVREMKNKLDELKAQESMKETYPEWESEYMHAYGEYQYVLKEAAACLEYSQKLANADNIYSVYGMKAWIISDRNYEQLIGESARLREFIIFIVSIIVVVIITVENIMLEQKTGMEYILNSSAYGRKKRWLRKYLAMVIFTGCFTLITCIIQFMIIKSLYGMPYINAPVLSLSFIYEKIGQGLYKINIFKNLLINLNIRQYIFIHYAKWIVISYVVMNVSILVSALWMHKRK